MNHHTSRIVSLLILIALSVLTLVLFVRFVPERIGQQDKALFDFSSRPTSSYQVITSSPQQMRCERGGGKWVECGNPCHGKNADTCITSCEAQCLCGGADRWTCSQDSACTDWEPNQADPLAIGVCRSVATVSSTVINVGVSSSTLGSGQVRQKPLGAVCDEQNFICVHSTLSKQAVNPLMVTGTAIAFESTIQWELLNASGTVLEHGFETVNAPDVGKPGDFLIKIFVRDQWNLSQGEARLRLFESSAQDGRAIHVVTVPVRFETKTNPVSFFLTSNMITSTSTCNVEAVQRPVVVSAKPIEAALTEFFLYQTPAAGYVTKSTPKDARLASVVLNNGTLMIRLKEGSFDKARGGSVLVGCIREEIERTTKQFSSVKQVLIIEGNRNAAETLQP